MIDSVIVGRLEENCYILYNDDNDKCILIDPGDEPELIEAKLKELNKEPAYILLTHGHFDHIGACKHFQEKGVKVYVHKNDASKLEYDRFAAMFGYSVPWFTADVLMNDGDILDLLGYRIEIMHTPGHSSGSAVIIVDSEKCMFVGDTIFFHSYGRYDFPDGSFADLKKSISRLFSLEGKDDYILYPGHGISTTLIDEKKYNMINASL